MHDFFSANDVGALPRFASLIIPCASSVMTTPRREWIQIAASSFSWKSTYHLPSMNSIGLIAFVYMGLPRA